MQKMFKEKDIEQINQSCLTLKPKFKNEKLAT